MGLKSHTLINLFLQGKRNIKVRHVDLLSKGLHLTSQESLYLKALIQYTNSDSIEERELNSILLTELNPGKEFTTKEIEEYRVMSDWSYSALLSTMDLSTFDGTLSGLSEKLGHRLSSSEIDSKVLRLKNLGLVTEGKGRITPTYKKTTTKNDVRDDGARELHKQAADLAKDAIDEIPLEQREFQSYAVTLDSRNLKKFKTLIRKFISQVSVESERGNTDEVYQFNIQFFQLTKSPSQIEE